MDAQLVRTTLLLALAAAVASARAPDAAAESRRSFGGTLDGSLLGEPVHLDPVRAASHAERELVALLFDTLYRFDEGGAVVPHLAAALPELSADGTSATIPLVTGVRFHDGTSLGPGDVAASLERARQARGGWMLAPIRRVAAADDAIVVELRRDTPELAELLAFPAASITPRGAAPRADAIGSGPFRLTSLDRRRQRVELTAFDEHFAGRPYVDRLRLRWFDDPDAEARAYEAGRAHLSLRGAVAFAGHQPKHPTDVVEGPATVLVYVGFGRAHPAVSESVHFRRALSLALARDGLRRVGTGEKVSAALHPQPYALGGPAPRASDGRARVRDAKRALARAKRDAPVLGRDALELEILVDETRPDDLEVAEKVVRALFTLGLEAKVVPLGARRFARRVERGQGDLYIGQLVPVGRSEALAVAAAFAAGGSRWARTRLAQRALDDRAARAAFETGLPVVPLFHRALRVHHRKSVRGVELDSLGRLSLADLFVGK